MEWIHIDQARPHEHRLILVAYAYVERNEVKWMAGTSVAKYEDGKFTSEFVPGTYEITHWMPLPKPPEL